MSQIENTGKNFSLEEYLGARISTIDILNKVAGLVKPGTTEKQATELMAQELEKVGIKKNWHPIKIRFGENTTKSFREKSRPGVILQEKDILFFDIGPVWNEHEGDIGRTFVTGDFDEGLKIKRACEEVFIDCVEKWKNSQLTGVELYQFANESAQSRGYILNMKMNGHRLGDFPHHVFYRGGLHEFEKRPIEALWVLEILLRHPEKQIGAFYEDIISSHI